MNDIELIAIGDTATDVFMELKDASLLHRPKKRGDELCVRFADKIAVESMKEIEGVGNAANVAIGASRLGVKAGLWTILGNDDDAKRIKEIFSKEKINQSFVEADKKKRTNFSVVLSYRAERTILVYHAPRNYRFPKVPTAKIIYFTSMGRGWEKTVPALFRYLKKTGAFLAFNPGTHQLKADASLLKQIIAKSYVVFANKEEVMKILGIKKGSTQLLLNGLMEIGPEMAIITDGNNGAVAANKKDSFMMPIVPAPIVERTGCGDAFAAGVLAALLKKKGLNEALGWGARNAASVIRFIGSREGLLTEDQMKELVKKETVQAQVI